MLGKDVARLTADEKAIDRRLTGLESAPFRELKAAVEQADVTTAEGQRSVIAAGFDGRVTPSQCEC